MTHKIATVLFCTCFGWGIILLIFANILNKFHYGVKMLSFGLLTVVTFSGLLIYLAVVSYQQRNKNGVFPNIGINNNYLNLFDLLVYVNLAFTVQTFFIPILD